MRSPCGVLLPEGITVNLDSYQGSQRRADPNEGNGWCALQRIRSPSLGNPIVSNRLIERSPGRLYGNESMNGRAFAERLIGRVGKWGTETDCNCRGVAPQNRRPPTRSMAVGTSNGVASFLSTTKLPRNAPTGRPVCAPARRYGHCSSGKAVGKLELGFVLSLQQQTIKHFPTSNRLRVAGILDLYPSKRVRASLGAYR